MVNRTLLLIAAWITLALPGHACAQAPQQPVELRVATFNLWDVRTADLLNGDQPRIKAMAEVLQRIRPNIVLLNEIAYDMPGGPDVNEDDEPGQNAQRFVDEYLLVPQGEGLRPLRYKAYMWPTNTGLPSGFDLNKDGEAVTSFPPPPPTSPDGTPGPQTPEGRAYGEDAWGFGTFPGQYGMALLVDERLEVLLGEVRTFRTLPWDYMPGAQLPRTEDGQGWYTSEELEFLRLSSKSHWDVPVKLPNGRVLHVLASHPTPPAFDGPEERNKRRNHDEIRFWADYIAGEPWIVDDTNKPGGLDRRAPFVILGDLNADPKKGNSFKDPMGTVLLASKRINSAVVPTSDLPAEGEKGALTESDTADFGLRVDYVLPSTELEPLRSGVWRHPSQLWGHGLGKSDGQIRFPSDHYPVWMDVRINSLP